MTVFHAVAAAQRSLTEIYALDLDLSARDCLVSATTARRLLPPRSPRSGVLALECEGQLSLGIYLDRRDHRDAGTIVEETSHWVCLAWHATHDRPISCLILELQGEIDRYVVARLEGRDAFAHFRGFAWDDWMNAAERSRYATAHRAGLRYCHSLAERYPHRSDTPALLDELRRFYRASPGMKLAAA